MSTYLMTGYYPFAHSRPDKIGAPRLLPLDLVDIYPNNADIA
jgi:hypothetical protein